MTMPHLMNCGHSDDGWCLDCVKQLWEEGQSCAAPNAVSLLVRFRNLYADGYTMSSRQWHAMVADWDSILDAAGVQKAEVAPGVLRWVDPVTNQKPDRSVT